jgi:plastocyanin
MVFSILGLVLFPVAHAKNFHVNVGKGALVFDPPFVQGAHKGDTITFTFNPKKHSVTQSTFDAPCTPLAGGFDSGLIPVDVDANTLPTWRVTVKHTSAPIWAYCKNPGPPTHCSQGMVFAVNPDNSGSHSFEAFQALAKLTGLAGMSNSSSENAETTTYATLPPPPSTVMVTVTATAASSTWTTTYASHEGNPPPTAAPHPVDHLITVGSTGALTFSPSNISASVGDSITFKFVSRNHTITRSSFGAPCQPLSDTTTDPNILADFFDSGFKPVANGTQDFPTFRITVKDTAPIWAYCRQTMGGSHCGKGMVFSANAVESGPNNFAAFQALAIHINGTSVTSSVPQSTGSASVTEAALWSTLL